MMQVSVDELGGPRFTVTLGVKRTSPVVTSDTAMLKVIPLQASQVPVPAPVQHANGVSAPVHVVLSPPVPLADTVKTPRSMLVPVHTEADESPQEGVCLMSLNVTFPVFCGALDVFSIDRLTGMPVFPTCTNVG
jgi:hypothetical protein